MSNIGNIQNVNLKELTGVNPAEAVRKTQNTAESPSGDFGKTISDFIMAVNADQKTSAREVSEVIQGKSENLHQAMASMEEARLSFQLMIEVRNKLMESYQTLQRMQV